MNFDFLEGVRGFEKIKPHCENAEDLVKTQPDSSLFKSRKSAEGIAKYIYLSLYAKVVENMQFVDVLNDSRVKRWLGRGRLADAFHELRKQGNSAVHNTDSEFSAEDAMRSLRYLHYVAGETARRMGLINSYPSFNADLPRHDQVKVLPISDQIAVEMYEDYMKTKFVAEDYYKKIMDLRTEEFVKFVSGNIVYNEVVELRSCPDERTIQLLKEHYGLLTYLKQKQLTQGCKDGEVEISLEMKLEVFGNDAYETSDVYEVLDGVFHDIEKSEGFRISSKYDGMTTEAWSNSDSERNIWEYCQLLVEASPQISYKFFDFSYNHGEGGGYKYENGEVINLHTNYSDKILDIPGNDWFCWYADLAVDFDFDKNPEILSALREAVKKHLPEEEYNNTAPFWEDGELGHLVVSAQWLPMRLRAIQDFLDEINAIIEPIKKECDCGADGTWYSFGNPYIIATWQWTEEGFTITGREW